ncbi:MAG: class I SAM-dependent methyltransferase [Terrimicrobiaceae bacterium]
MEINLLHLKAAQQNRSAAHRSDHSSTQRIHPSIWQYDYLTLNALASDIAVLLQDARRELSVSQRQSIDIGCNTSPYREDLEKLGFVVQTLDLDLSNGADFEGTVEETGLPDACADLLICTQVLEHCSEPWKAAPEMFRVLRTGGLILASVPHVWFYHPHPDDNWRFTPEGVFRLFNAAGFETTKMLLQGGSVLSLFQIINFCIFGLLGRAGAPVFVCLNVFGSVLDRLFPNPLFPINIAILARKPPTA